MVVGWGGCSAGKRTGVQLLVPTQSPATPAPGDPTPSSPPRATDSHSHVCTEYIFM